MLAWMIFVCTVMLIVSLVVTVVEAKGGYLGDGSLVPGVLFAGFVVLVLSFVAGLLSGNITIQ